MNPLRPIAGLDSFGAFSIDLTNTSLIDQQSAQPEWAFSFCSNEQVVPQVCFNVPALALTSSQSITTQINAAPPALLACGAVNFASPPPIGNVTPNTGTFTDLESKKTPYIDARTYGAVCDGNGTSGTDNSAALQAAINAAEVVTNGTSLTAVFLPAGECRFGTTLNVLPAGVNGIAIFGPPTGPHSWQEGAILTYTGSGVAMQLGGNPSSGESIHLHDLTIRCNGNTASTNTCTELVDVYKGFGPIYIDHIFFSGYHNNTSGAGSYGAAKGLVMNGAALQVSVTDNFFADFSGTEISALSGTNITIRNNQLFDAPTGIKTTGVANVDVGNNYFELMTHATEIDNSIYWTFGQYSIHDNQFNLETIPPTNNQTNTGAQRCLYVRNTGGPVLVMGAKISFHDNQCNVSDGYVFSSTGCTACHALYGVEFNMTPSYAFNINMDSYDNYYAGVQTSGIYGNSAFLIIGSRNDQVTTDFQPYELTSGGTNTSPVSGSYTVPALGPATFSSLNVLGNISAGGAVYSAFSAAPTVYGSDSVSGHGYVTLSTGDATHTGFIKWFDQTSTAIWHEGYDSGGNLTTTRDSGTGVFNIAAPLDINSVQVIDGSQNVLAGGGTNIVYYCNAGVSLNSMCRGNGCSCVGGTWVDTGLRVK